MATVARARLLAFGAHLPGVILEVSQRAEVGQQGVFGLKSGLPGCLESGDERLLVGDNLARNGDTLHEQNEFGPFPRHLSGRHAESAAAMPAEHLACDKL